MAISGRRFADSSITIEAQVFGGPESAAAYVACRRRGPRDAGYQFGVQPARQRVQLGRYGDNRFTLLVDQPSLAVRGPGQVNRIELTCSGSTIIGSVNGIIAVSVLDTTWVEGTHNFGVSGGGARARFDNLVITQG